MLYNAKCLDILKTLEDNSIDLLVTDPPYGYSFMGKDWDKAVVDVEKWKECLRVLKPGAFAFIMSAPRQDVLSRMIVNLQDAGFMTGFTSMYWTYASGFPKAGNVSKFVDKRLGVEFETSPASGVGFMNIKDDGYHTTKNQMKRIGKTSSQAKALDGSYLGFQPKPAVEVIIVVMKPLSEKSYIDQAMKDGKGISWFDNCRIPYKNEDDYDSCIDKRKSFDNQKGEKQTKENSNVPFNTSPWNHIVSNQGRFPANLLVSDDVLNDGKVRKIRGNKKTEIRNSFCFNLKCDYNQDANYSDSGSFSRYFDLDKWWTEQIKKLPKSVQKTLPFLIVPKASKGEKNKGCEGLKEKPTVKNANTFKDGLKFNIDLRSPNGGYDVKHDTKMKNIHPTVKPLKLFSYLVTLGSRKDDTILDPFIGSGTTAIACEMLDRNWIGIEKEEEYYKIAQCRIKDITKINKLF